MAEVEGDVPLKQWLMQESSWEMLLLSELSLKWPGMLGKRRPFILQFSQQNTNTVVEAAEIRKVTEFITQ